MTLDPRPHEQVSAPKETCKMATRKLTQCTWPEPEVKTKWWKKAHSKTLSPMRVPQSRKTWHRRGRTVAHRRCWGKAAEMVTRMAAQKSMRNVATQKLTHAASQKVDLCRVREP